MKSNDKMKTKIPHNSKIKYQNRRKSQKSKSIPLTQIHDLSLPRLGTGTSIKSGGVKLVFMIDS